MLLPVLFPFVPKSVLPRQVIADEPPNVLPIVQVPGRERRLLETMPLAMGEFITDPHQGCEDEKAPRPSSLGYLLGQKTQQVVGVSRLVTQLQGNFC